MPYEVVLTNGAETDLEAIYDYILEQDGLGKADHVLDLLIQTTDNLAHFPHKGIIPKELQELGIQDYRQVFFKPYRIIYHAIHKRVVIFIITDGRRDMQALLARRLLGRP